MTTTAAGRMPARSATRLIHCPDRMGLVYIVTEFIFKNNFHVILVDKYNKPVQEQQQLALLREHRIDFIVLARYMQIVSSSFIEHFPNRIINIHHSFLPAFPGAKPYHSAHERGVKIIGATSHLRTTLFPVQTKGRR